MWVRKHNFIMLFKLFNEYFGQKYKAGNKKKKLNIKKQVLGNSK